MLHGKSALMMIFPLRRVLPAMLTAVLVAMAGPALAEGDLAKKFSAFDTRSTLRIDNTAWNAFLKRYIIRSAAGVHLIRYGSVSKADHAALKRYLAGLQAVKVARLSRDEAMAFWINLYNALTVDVILDHFPVRSIRDIRISPGLFSLGPWGRKLVTVAGARLSLDDIEHEILRKIWRDSRIHYAVNCAAMGCPNLAARAYSADRLNAMLDAGARDYINNPRAVRKNRDGSLTLSKLYKWYAEDFGERTQLFRHLRRYARGKTAVLLGSSAKISRYEYDWTINDPTVRPGH